MSDLEQINRRNMKVLVTCVSVVVAMVGLSFASVPLYKVFCQVTGYGGTTQVAAEAPSEVLDREVTVRFDANVAPGLAWDFAPEAVSQTLQIGEVSLAFYTSENYGRSDTTGVATFNVTPLSAGQYFHKIQCFCFNEQTLEAGEHVRMPVYYYVDAALDDDPLLDHVETITLSYTFFAVDGPQASSRLRNMDVAASDRVVIDVNIGQTGP